MVKIAFMSDTHNRHTGTYWPNVDILIHCGDFTAGGSEMEVRLFGEWVNRLTHVKHKLITPGNHDRLVQDNPELAAKYVTTIQDGLVEVEGLKIYMSPWTPRFGPWAFMKERGEEIKERWDQIPEGIDILVTHGPPFGILDEVPDGLRVGCRDLLDRVVEVKPKIHAFGHVHSGAGQVKLGDTLFVNAAICDEVYVAVNKPIIVEI